MLVLMTTEVLEQIIEAINTQNRFIEVEFSDPIMELEGRDVVSANLTVHELAPFTEDEMAVLAFSRVDEHIRHGLV
jgi:hypothetical protein